LGRSRLQGGDEASARLMPLFWIAKTVAEALL